MANGDLTKSEAIAKVGRLEAQRKRIRDEGKLMVTAAVQTIAGHGVSLLYGVIEGATGWDGFIPGTATYDDAGNVTEPGLRADLVLGLAAGAYGIFYPKGLDGQMAVAAGIGLGAPAVRDYGLDIGRKIAES